MRFDHYTIKSREALERAQRLAAERTHQELQPEHLLAAQLDDAEGTTASVLQKLGVPREPLAQSAGLALERLTRVTGPAAGRESMVLGESPRRVLEGAEQAAERLKDEFISVEHLLLALSDPERPGEAQRTLAKAGVKPEGAGRRRGISVRDQALGPTFAMTPTVAAMIFTSKSSPPFRM